MVLLFYEENDLGVHSSCARRLIGFVKGKRMINILLEGYGIKADYLYDELKKYILPNYSVAVMAFSFRDSQVKNSADWNLLYSKEKGIYYRGIVSGFTAYGISENNIEL